MKIGMRSGLNSESLGSARWDHAIIGTILDDDRSKAALNFVTRHCGDVHSLTYEPATFSYTLDGKGANALKVSEEARSMVGGSLLLEATTLRFTEILTCLRVGKEAVPSSISILYVEPAAYHRPKHSHVLHRRDFELTDEFEPFSGVPGSIIRLGGDRPVKAVFLLGYEGQRLSRALQENNIHPSKCSVVFGIPAFKPGWEMDAFANNVESLLQPEPWKGILYAGANNVLAAFDAIRDVYESCDATVGERLIIVPIGTKPHALGAALFACEHRDVGVIYDNPRRKHERSRSTATWHLYEITWTG